MPGFHVNDLKSNTTTYARGYLFYVTFTSAPPAGDLTSDPTPYLVRSSSLPESTIDPIEVPWQGQMYKIGSTHTFAEWTCTFNTDISANIRRNFLTWMQSIHNPATNVQGAPADYQGEANLELLDTQGNPIMTYTLHQLWPSSIGALELAHDSKDVAQFDVTFNYNWHTYE